MSDFVTPDSGITDSPPILGGMAVASHPDYIFTYEEGTQFISGDNLPVKWTIKRKDGANVDVPSEASVFVRDASNALIGTLSLDLENNIEATEQVLAALWAVPGIGGYTLQITVSVGADGQVRSDRQIVQVV